MVAFRTVEDSKMLPCVSGHLLDDSYPGGNGHSDNHLLQEGYICEEPHLSLSLSLSLSQQLVIGYLLFDVHEDICAEIRTKQQLHVRL